MGAFLDKPKTEKINDAGSTPTGSLRYGLAAMQGWRIEMEDSHIAKTSLPPPFTDFAFFGVFDGHAGAKIAKYSANCLLDTILQTNEFKTLSNELQQQKSTGSQETFRDSAISISGSTADVSNNNNSHRTSRCTTPGSVSAVVPPKSPAPSVDSTPAKSASFQKSQPLSPTHSEISSISSIGTTISTMATTGGKLILSQKQMNLIVSGVKNGFLTFDDKMRHLPQLHSENERSGTTAVCALISPTHVFLINLGDSRGLFARAGTVDFATEDHKPYLPKERERIINAGGSVMIQRVNGSLAVSRALGDYDYKNAASLRACEQLVSPEPDVTILERDVSGGGVGVGSRPLTNTTGGGGGATLLKQQRLQSPPPAAASSAAGTPSPPTSPISGPISPAGSASPAGVCPESPLGTTASRAASPPSTPIGGATSVKTPPTSPPPSVGGSGPINSGGGSSRDEFLLLACDGVFDVMTNQELCEFVRSRLCVTSRLEVICNQILDCCLSKGSKDNMSVILITFPGAPQVSTDAVQREQQFEKQLSDRINEIVQLCDNTNDVDIDYVLRALMSQEIPGLPPGAGLHAKRSLVESVLDSIKSKCNRSSSNQHQQQTQIPQSPQHQQQSAQHGSAPTISSAKLTKSP